MEFSQFAKTNRLKVTHDECGDAIIVGKQGQLYPYTESEMGVMFMPPKTKSDSCGRWCPKVWGNFKRAAALIGMVLTQEGDSEGCLSFDPLHKEQVKLAVKIAGVRVRKTLSPERKAALAATLAAARSQRAENLVSNLV
ncbi:MAG: hypothetical protein WB566_17420 [Terriglobales bacterium]